MSANVFGAVAVFAPGVPGTVSVTSSSSAATAIPTLALNGGKLWLKCSSKAHIIFGLSNVTDATSSHMPITADQDYLITMPGGWTHFKIIRSSADGTLHYSVA